MISLSRSSEDTWGYETRAGLTEATLMDAPPPAMLLGILATVIIRTRLDTILGRRSG